jgi:hypothetical protein
MTERKKYDFERLQNYCSENNITLLEDYTNIPLKGNVIIKGKCVYENCNNNFEKKFNYLINSNSFCIECTNNIKIKKSKKTNLEKYGCEHSSQNLCVKNKIILTNLKKYGCKYSTQSQIMKTKSIETNLKLYGVKHAMQNNEIKTKTEDTNLKKYGCKNVFQNKDIINKIKLNSIKKIGVSHNMQLETSKEIFKNTCFEKYGVTNPSQSENIKNKKIETSLKNWGVEHPFQNSDIMEKNIKSSFTKKEYIFPSGKIDKIQGYENFALDELIINEKIDESDIITGCKNVPEIWYNDKNNKKRRHYVDIFIPSQNKCIEVKSTWTAKQNEHNIFLKQNAAKALGYKYEIWIYNNKKEKINCYD